MVTSKQTMSEGRHSSATFSQNSAQREFHPGQLARYYGSDLGQYVRLRLCEGLDVALHDLCFRKEIAAFFRSLNKRQITTYGFGYAVPYLETFLRNFDASLAKFNQIHPDCAVTTTGMALIPPDSSTPDQLNGVYCVRMATRLPPRVQAMSVQYNDWFLPDRSVPVLVLAHALEETPDLDQLLNEAHRVMMPGGELFVFAFHPWTLWLASPNAPTNPTRYFDLHTLRHHLGQHYFRFVGYSVIGSLAPWRKSCPAYRTCTGETARRAAVLCGTDFLLRNWFPLFGGVIVVRARKMSALD